jgi:hypothetical protein
MLIKNFDDLLKSAHQQPDAQRLLFVFAGSELPDDCTPVQRSRFEAGLGGALAPLMEVDKLPDQLKNFDQLVDESLKFAQGTPAEHWSIVFVGALGGEGRTPPGSQETDMALRRMTDSIRAGEIKPYITFDRMGHMVKLQAS